MKVVVPLALAARRSMSTSPQATALAVRLG
jgi:hypothetical protein